MSEPEPRDLDCGDYWVDFLGADPVERELAIFELVDRLADIAIDLGNVIRTDLEPFHRAGRLLEIAGRLEEITPAISGVSCVEWDAAEIDYGIGLFNFDPPAHDPTQQ